MTAKDVHARLDGFMCHHAILSSLVLPANGRD